MLSLIIPTYNERGNIRPLWEGLCRHLEYFEAIFVDDNSPDGTAREIEALQDPRARLLSRPRKLGLGSAVVAGLDLARGDYIGMMDADLSHRPEDVARLYQVVREADITIGSRYVPGGRIVGWPLRRKIISRGATLLAWLLLWKRVRDPLSGLAIYRRGVLEAFYLPGGAIGAIIVNKDGLKVLQVPAKALPEGADVPPLVIGRDNQGEHCLWLLRA